MNRLKVSIHLSIDLSIQLSIHLLINPSMGVEIWKAIGMNMQNVRFLWASDEINAHAEEYWTLV